MDEPGTTRQWLRVGLAEAGETRALMRIVEAVIIVTAHTYTSFSYTTFSKEYGILKRDNFREVWRPVMDL